MVVINEESTVVGVTTSDSGELEMTWESVIEGVMTDEAVSGVSGSGGDTIRSAGLGKVLNVEPSDVYLEIEEGI